jgi:hypothetical protein
MDLRPGQILASLAGLVALALGCIYALGVHWIPSAVFATLEFARSMCFRWYPSTKY